jgi:hypothetical protein
VGEIKSQAKPMEGSFECKPVNKATPTQRKKGLGEGLGKGRRRGGNRGGTKKIIKRKTSSPASPFFHEVVITTTRTKKKPATFFSSAIFCLLLSPPLPLPLSLALAPLLSLPRRYLRRWPRKGLTWRRLECQKAVGSRLFASLTNKLIMRRTYVSAVRNNWIFRS